VLSPCAPTREADSLDNVHAHLADVNEEEDEELKGAVTPAAEEEIQKYSEKKGRNTVRHYFTDIDLTSYSEVLSWLGKFKVHVE